MATALELLRRSRALSRSALAREIGVSHSALALYETGGALPAVDTAIAYARALGITVEELTVLIQQARASRGIKAEQGRAANVREEKKWAR